MKCRQEYKEICTNKVAYPAPDKRIATSESSTSNEENISNTSSYEPWYERLWMYAVVVIVWITLILIGIFIVYLFHSVLVIVHVHGISSLLPSIRSIESISMLIWYILGFIAFCVLFPVLMFFVLAMCCHFCHCIGPICDKFHS